MPRLPKITSREQVPADGQAAFDAITGSRGAILGPFTVMLYAPQLAERVANLGALVRFGLELPQLEFLTTMIAAIREFDCEYEWGAWSSQAARAGVRPEVIEVVGRRGSLEALTETEAMCIRYAREVVSDHRVSQPTFDAMLAFFGERGLVEVTGAIGYFSLLACTLNAFEVEQNPGMSPLPK